MYGHQLDSAFRYHRGGCFPVLCFRQFLKACGKVLHGALFLRRKIVGHPVKLAQVRQLLFPVIL